MKMAVNLWMLEVEDRSQIQHLIPFIRDGKGTFRVSFYYPEGGIKNDLPDVFDEIFHRVFIKGDNTEAILYAYIELFSAVKYLVLLNDDYSGPDTKAEYSWDVLNRKKISPSFDFSISREKLLEMMRPKVTPSESMKKHLSILYHTTEIVQKCAELERSFEKCSNDVVKLFVGLPMTRNDLHAFALGSEGFLVEVFEQMLSGFVKWVDSARLSNDAMPATQSFLALRNTSLELAKNVSLRKYPVGVAINRESLLVFTVELLSQITGYMGGDEKQAMEMFVRRHKPRETSAAAA